MMKDKVSETIKKHEMIPSGSKVIVALSGGSDSVSLLMVLNQIKNELSFSLEAAHVNHMLRGIDADNDELFVKSLCESINVPLHILHADIKNIAKESGESLEEAGRRVRYEYFASLGDDCLIATAHNLNDRIETFLFNFSRGSALRGLCSIPHKRGNIIRPILDCSKEEILKYLQEINQNYCTDSTNTDVKYSRNRIRHNVIPELSKINSSFESSCKKCIDSLNEDEKYLSGLALNLVKDATLKDGYSIELLNNAPYPIKMRALAIIIEAETDNMPDRKSLDSVSELIRDYSENKDGKSIQIPNGSARTGYGMLIFPKTHIKIEDEYVISKPVQICGEYRIEFKIEKNNSQTVSKSENIILLDYDKISGNITVTSRRSGDEISLPGRNLTKSLRKLQNEKGISPEERETLPVFRDNQGILACFKCGVDKRVSVDSKTQNLAVISILKINN